MLHGALRYAYRERQDDDDRDEPEPGHGSCDPKSPQQHEPSRPYCVLCAAAETGRFGVVKYDGPTPHGFKCNDEKAEAKRVGNKLAPSQREAKGAQQANSDPAESKPADEHHEPPAPEP